MIWIEAIAVCFGLAGVYLVARQNIWCWPVGLISVALYVLIFFDARLYSDLILHVVYVGLQVYGWIHWTRGGESSDALPVTRLSGRINLIWGVAVLVGTGLWGWTMVSFTNASFPYGDAFTTVASLAAQWLTARKRIESWIWWFVIDTVAIGIYLAKSLFLTSILYFCFLALCFIGYRDWKRSLGHASSPTTPPVPA